MQDNNIFEKAKYWLIIAGFFVMTVCVYPVWILIGGTQGADNAENRNMAELPSLSKETISSFPAEMEEYINDHLPFRSRLIEWNSILDYFLFHTSSNEKVILGTDGWMYYTVKDSIGFYTGRKQYTQEQLETIAQNMQKTKDDLEAEGIRFALFIAPDKEQVYPEYLPAYYKKLAAAHRPQQTALEQVLAYLEQNTDIEVICPLQTLQSYKDTHPEQTIYHLMDTHWNDLGAWLGVCDLMEALQIPIKRDVDIEKTEDKMADLAGMLALHHVLKFGDEYKVKGYQHPDTELLESVFYGDFHYVSPSCNTGKLLVCRDSFCSAMAPVLGECFTESIMVHKNAFKNTRIEEEQPDIFVYEVVERSLDDLLEFVY